MTSIRTAALAALLSALALSAHAQERSGRFFEEMDTNRDGFVDPEEYTLRKGAILYSLDANHDLKIEQKETRLSPAQFGQYAGGDGFIDGGEFFELPGASFGAFDRNGDRRISREEFRLQVAELRSGQQTAEGR